MDIDRANKTFGEWGYIAVAKHYRKILKHEAKVLKDKNPEQLHQMRVGMRRLRSTISGFIFALDLPPAAEIAKIAKIAKVLGKLRDIDVLQETLTVQYQPYLPVEEQESLNVIFKALKKRRKLAFKKVKQTLHGQSYLDLKFGLEAWLDNPTYQRIGLVEIERVLPDLLLPQISYFFLHPGWLIGVKVEEKEIQGTKYDDCLLYTSPSPRDLSTSRMPSSA